MVASYLDDQVGQHEAPLLALDTHDEEDGDQDIDGSGDGLSQDDGPEVLLDVGDDLVNLVLVELVFLQHLLEHEEELLQVFLDGVELVPLGQVGDQGDELGRG